MQHKDPIVCLPCASSVLRKHPSGRPGQSRSARPRSFSVTLLPPDASPPLNTRFCPLRLPQFPQTGPQGKHSPRRTHSPCTIPSRVQTRRPGPENGASGVGEPCTLQVREAGQAVTRGPRPTVSAGAQVGGHSSPPCCGGAWQWRPAGESVADARITQEQWRDTLNARGRHWKPACPELPVCRPSLGLDRAHSKLSLWVWGRSRLGGFGSSHRDREATMSIHGTCYLLRG